MEQKIKDILFELVGQSKLHPITKTNFILEVDYEKYTKEILDVFTEYQKTHQE